MSIKYFNSNSKDCFEFTREELENLLNDVYDEGRKNEEVLPIFELLEKPAYNETSKDVNSTYCTDTDSIGKIILEKVKGD